MADLHPQLRLSQAPHFSPRLQHGVRLLQMSSLDYARELHDAASENPFLDVEETPVPDWAQAAALDRLSDSGTPRQGAVPASSDGLDALHGIAVEVSLREHLHQQLGVLRLDPAARYGAEAVIESLDDDGYLRLSLDEIARAVDIDPATGMDELRTAVCRVQSLDPAGVGARSLEECLHLQLEALPPATPARGLALRLVAGQLPLMAARKLPRLAAALGSTVAEAERACDLIRRLSVRPGWRFGSQGIDAITPDVIVRKVRGTWTTVLNDAAFSKMKMNSAYERLFERHRERKNPEMSGCLERARWTLQNLAQRVSTIRDVAQAIVARQKLFLEHGALALKPLGLREIADAVGVHPSTVSRAVHHKYMATPGGVFELKYFFSRGVQHGSGRASAPGAVQALIGELVAGERGDAPLSDAELARQLATQGFSIARRTVTKYRQQLRLLPVEQRRHA